MLQLILSLFLLPAVMQDARHLLDPKLVPMNGATTKAFVPKGWKSQDEQTGDLNSDGLPDAVLQLIEDKPVRDAKDEFQERQRAMLILFKTADGNYRRAAVANRLLMCASCGGMLGGTGEYPVGEVKIEKGVLIVSQLAGSRNATDLLQRFRYDPATKKFLMIGQDVNNFDRMTGESEVVSTNYLTGKQVIEKKQYNPKTDKYVTTAQKTKVVPKTRKSIEQVDYEQ